MKKNAALHRLEDDQGVVLAWVCDSNLRSGSYPARAPRIALSHARRQALSHARRQALSHARRQALSHARRQALSHAYLITHAPDLFGCLSQVNGYNFFENLLQQLDLSRAI
jgi:hypothetical protein